MADNGQNGDPVAGDQVYSIATTLTAPAASSLPLQVVATTGTAGTVSANFSVQVVQIPSYATNAAINQAEAQIYSTAVQTRTIFTNPNWSTPNVLQEISGNLISMFSQFAGVANQNTALQSASIGLKGIRRAGIQSNNVHSEGIGQDILNFLSLGFFSPAQSGQSCDQLVQSFGPLRSTSTLPLLDPNDPNLKALADELVDLCPSDIQCPGPITEDDLLGNYNLVAAEWAVQYLSIGPPLPTPIAGCNGGTGKTLANVGVKADLEQFTDLTGAGLTTALGSGEISQQLIGQANDTLVGFAVDSSGNSRVMIGQAAPNETFAVPAGTYNLAARFGGDSANATLTNSPVYPNSITNISPLPGIILWLDPPEIQSFSPTFGPVGTPVTLSGYGFNPPSGSLTSINFNGANATVPSATDSSMTVVVPPGATTGPITVITTVGETTSSISFTVTASAGNPVPTIAGLNPSSLAAGAAPQTLTINGTGFLDSSTVTFNGISHAATFVNAGQLTISLTSADLATVGTYPVVVTNPAPGGGASIAKSFNVTNGQTANEWTWMSGADTAGQLGVYGTQGVPSVANVPGSRTEAASWTDSSGNFWLFGGATLSGTFNDLWRFNPTNDEWTWMSGSSSMNQPGVYGTQGVPAAANVPGSRGLATSWTDSNGNLWLFGGSTDTNDLWQFSPATQLWTWISGSGSYGTPGVYGTQGVPAATNVPGGRNEALGWIDSNGNLWLFGGSGYDSAGVYGELNDLWEFNPTTKMWTWVSGSSSMNQLGVYGTQGVPAATNVPGGRNGAISWTDTGGSLWLFGGNGFDGGNDSGGLLNDLWEFQPTTKKWTWVSGSSSANQPGVYGTQGVPAATNIPGGREYAVSWIDGSGNLWLFGGGYNDLWEYSPTTNLWTWVSGSSSGSHPGVYGTESVPAATNVPGTRESSATWVDGSGNLWLFGGAGSFSGGEELNDLWRYQP
jgi:N-acetylneuraminic acid mutarotase